MKPKLTEEMLRKAAWEAGCAMIRSLPSDKECEQHEFSPEFCARMEALIASLREK